MNELIERIKTAAIEAVMAGKPVSVVHGEVVQATPLEIMVDQKLLLMEKQLILTSAVRDQVIEMTVDHRTETSGSPTEHSHAYSGRKQFTVHRALKQGEHVLLLRADGGQMYVVLDRMEAGR